MSGVKLFSLKQLFFAFFAVLLFILPLLFGQASTLATPKKIIQVESLKAIGRKVEAFTFHRSSCLNNLRPELIIRKTYKCNPFTTKAVDGLNEISLSMNAVDQRISFTGSTILV